MFRNLETLLCLDFAFIKFDQTSWENWTVSTASSGMKTFEN